MRKSALALVAILLAGCSSSAGNTYGDAWTLLRSAVAASAGNVRVTREQAAAVPYASMGWRLGNGNQTLIILATDNGGERLWTSSAHIVLVTRDGRLIRSVGLGYDLAGTTPKSQPVLPSPAAAVQAPFDSRRLADYPDLGRYGVEIDCHSHTVARVNIMVLGHAIATTRIDEDCSAPSLRWHFTDSYWADADGVVWRARQHIHPRQDELEMVLFRPPG